MKKIGFSSVQCHNQIGIFVSRPESCFVSNIQLAKKFQVVAFKIPGCRSCTYHKWFHTQKLIWIMNSRFHKTSQGWPYNSDNGVFHEKHLSWLIMNTQGIILIRFLCFGNISRTTVFWIFITIKKYYGFENCE